MKKLSFLFLAAVCFGIILPAPAQSPKQELVADSAAKTIPEQGPIIYLSEFDASGKQRQHFPTETMGIVDINSNIGLDLQINQIETQMLEMYGVPPGDERLRQLEKLNVILKQEVEITNYINRDFNKYEASYGEQIEYFSGLYSLGGKLLTEIEKIDLELAKELRQTEVARARQAYYKNHPEARTYPQFLLYYLNQKAAVLREELVGSLGLSENDSAVRVYFRLGAFIRNKDGGRPIHVENFDNYNRESYQVKSFLGQPVTEKEQAKLQETARLNNQLGGNIQQTVDNFKKVIRGYGQEITSIKSDFDTLKTVYQTSLQELRAAAKTSAVEVLERNRLDQMQAEELFNQLGSFFQKYESQYSPDMSRDERIAQTLSLLKTNIQTRHEAFKRDLDSYIAGTDVDTTTEKNLKLIKTTFDDFRAKGSNRIQKLTQLVAKMRTALRPFRRAYLENEKFSQQVNRFGIGRIPATGMIELNYIGTVSPGDEIVIKATLERGTDREDPGFVEKPLFRKVIKIQRVNPYVRMSGSIIMANPYTRDQAKFQGIIDLENTYQFAPTYGIILKKGSRKSSFYNSFVDLGIGLAFSSPDFDTDGTPEFGAGIMVTAFKDIVSAGWGWNFGHDAPYGFIGFNIPFSIGGLPNSNAGRFGE